MEQSDNKTKHESQLELGDEYQKVQDREFDGLREPNATFLTDLNLLIVALSVSSICNEDCLNLVDTEKKDIKDLDANKGKACILRLHARKRETNDVKLKRRQTQKTKTIPKDFREGFKIALNFYTEASKCVTGILPCSFILVDTALHMNEELKATAFTRIPCEEIMERLVQVSKLIF
ncbi:hypothetical protein CRYUN_Cryun23aG0129400 [Craigia yunnanensis]